MKPTPEEALVEAENYVAARDRAHWRSPAPNGGDPFMENIEQARRHYENLVRLIGQKEAARLVRKLDTDQPRIAYETPLLMQQSRKKRGSRSR